MSNFYERLGVNRSASMEEIRKAYKRLAKKYHPDVNHGDPKAAEQFKKVKEAYDTLYNSTLREAYDAKLDGGANQAFSQASKKQTTTRPTAQSQEFDINEVNQTFERFFGFHPKTKNGNLNQTNRKKNPLDTTELFDRYFGK